MRLVVYWAMVSLPPTEATMVQGLAVDGMADCYVIWADWWAHCCVIRVYWCVHCSVIWMDWRALLKFGRIGWLSEVSQNVLQHISNPVVLS